MTKCVKGNMEREGERETADNT